MIVRDDLRLIARIANIAIIAKLRGSLKGKAFVNPGDFGNPGNCR
jgi:hypothetical protein